MRLESRKMQGGSANLTLMRLVACFLLRTRTAVAVAGSSFSQTKNSPRLLSLKGLHPMTVIDFDIDHAPKDHSNRRNNLPGCAAWEIHLTMKIQFTD